MNRGEEEGGGEWLAIVERTEGLEREEGCCELVDEEGLLSTGRSALIRSWASA